MSKFLILGMGLMGPAIAKDCAESPEVELVTGCDIDESKLESAKKYVNNKKFETTVLSVTEHQDLVNKMKGYDVVINGTASRFNRFIFGGTEKSIAI